MIGRDDFETLHFTARELAKFAPGHHATDLLNLLAVERLFATTNFKAVVWRRIVAGSDLNSAVEIAYDGDADRIGAVDEQGNILWGDELLVLFARDMLKRNPGALVISEVKCSQRLYDDIAKQGGRAIMWKAGHSLLKAKMKETGALLAGEMSGHMFFKERYFGYDDAVYASLRLLEIIASSEKPLSALLADLPKSFSTPELRVECSDDKKFEIADKATEYFRRYYDVIDVDGVRVQFADGWGLIRASNTQPALVLRFEAQSADKLQEYRALVENKLKEFELQ